MVAEVSQSHIGPEWLTHRYDPEDDVIHLLRADRSLRASAPFLTDEYLGPAGGDIVPARRTDVLAMARSSPIHFIFHSAYCCSTLVANAYDDPRTASSLKEPLILNDIVGWRHRGGAPARIGEVLDNVLALLARPFETGEAMIVKPSNVVNALIPAMLTMRPEARAVLLYTSLDQYLGSIARKGLWTRLWVRDLLMKQHRDGLLENLGFASEDLFLLSDLQVAAVGWIAQQRLFASIVDGFGDRVRTLDSEQLLAAPRETLAALDNLYRIPRDGSQRAAVVERVFGRHAKFGGDFDSNAREADRQSAIAAHGDEIEKVSTWAAAVAEGAGVMMIPPAPLR